MRPRLEPRNYVESPDVIVLSDEEPKVNGFTNGYESDSSDLGDLPPLLPIKVRLIVCCGTVLTMALFKRFFNVSLMYLSGAFAS